MKKISKKKRVFLGATLPLISFFLGSFVTFVQNLGENGVFWKIVTSGIGTGGVALLIITLYWRYSKLDKEEQETLNSPDLPKQ